MSANPLPSGEAARRLGLAHLYVTQPLRLDHPRQGELGQAPARAVIGGVSADRKGWLFAWVAYVRSTAEAPRLGVWPAAGQGTPFEAVLSASDELELIGRVDTPERAVARLAHHLKVIVMARIDPDVEYLHRAVGAYRAELRRDRDRAAAFERTADEE
jgi:hypothetical protein